MLTMYARLRGIPEYKIKDIVTDAINLLNLGKWADSLCGNYRYNLKWAYFYDCFLDVFLFALIPTSSYISTCFQNCLRNQGIEALYCKSGR